MNSGASIVVGLGCLAILIAGILWQGRLWLKYSPLKFWGDLWEIGSPYNLTGLTALLCNPYFRIHRLLNSPNQFVLDRDGEMARQWVISEREAIRISTAATISVYLIVGSFIFTIYEIIDPGTSVPAQDRLIVLAAIALFSGLFFVKSFLAPIILACTASWALFSWFQHGSPELFPLFQFIVEVLLARAPAWIKGMYVYVYILYGILSVAWSEWDISTSWLKSVFGE